MLVEWGTTPPDARTISVPRPGGSVSDGSPAALWLDAIISRDTPTRNGLDSAVQIVVGD